MIPDIVFNRALLIRGEGRGRVSIANKIILSRDACPLLWAGDYTELPSSLQAVVLTGGWEVKNPVLCQFILLQRRRGGEVLHCDVVFMSHCVGLLAWWVGGVEHRYCIAEQPKHCNCILYSTSPLSETHLLSHTVYYPSLLYTPLEPSWVDIFQRYHSLSPVEKS